MRNNLSANICYADKVKNTHVNKKQYVFYLLSSNIANNYLRPVTTKCTYIRYLGSDPQMGFRSIEIALSKQQITR